MEIGRYLKTLRENRGLTQKELAEKTGVTQSMIAQIERGSKVLSIPLCIDIAAVLCVAPYEILKNSMDFVEAGDEQEGI